MRGLKIATPVALRVLLGAALGCVAVSEVAAQTLYDDRVVWELASWPDVDSSGAPLTQTTSHEDWFYSITQSRTVLGVHDGFVAAGYTKYPDVSSTTCRASCFGDPCPMATISKIGPGGGVEWFEHNNAEGSFWRVIDTSDGGFLAVGHSHDRPLFDYNPVNSIGGIGLSCSPTNEADYRLIIIAKYDHAGTRQWQYAYGAMEDPDEYLPGVGTQVQASHDNAWGAVERASGGYRVVGHAVNPADGMNPQAFVIDIGEDGSVVDRRVFGDTGHRSEFFGIARSDEDYYLVGTQYDAAFDADPYGDVFVIKLGEDLKEEPLATTQLMTTEEEQDTGFDIAIAGDGYAHVAYVENCVAAGRGGCFRLGPGGIGEAFVARLDPADLSMESQTSLGIVHAHDLFVRLTALSDGGVGFVSTIQPDQQFEPSFTHTDAYVVKLDEEGDIVWHATHDARTSMPHTGTGDLSQECLYDIAEAEDGGLVVAGNNSSNDDDNYVLRFAIDDVPALPAPMVAHSHLVFPELGFTPNTLELSGDLMVAATGRLWVDAGRTLAFEDG